MPGFHITQVLVDYVYFAQMLPASVWKQTEPMLDAEQRRMTLSGGLRMMLLLTSTVTQDYSAG